MPRPYTPYAKLCIWFLICIINLSFGKLVTLTLNPSPSGRGTLRAVVSQLLSFALRDALRGIGIEGEDCQSSGINLSKTQVYHALTAKRAIFLPLPLHVTPPFVLAIDYRPRANDYFKTSLNLVFYKSKIIC